MYLNCEYEKKGQTNYNIYRPDFSQAIGPLTKKVKKKELKKTLTKKNGIKKEKQSTVKSVST